MRVPAGWTVSWNSLYEVDPGPDTIDWLYGSVLVSADHAGTGLCFDTRWEPEGDPQGCYVVDFLRLDRRRGGRVGAGVLLGTWTTRSRPALVAALEEFMFTREVPGATYGTRSEGGPDRRPGGRGLR
ncbi:hypothetical protein ACFW5D_32885 [Streptomyces sp. NPDC058770]|uniref:hypothetical protein n=1 Tax=Streptomyces sp. NPDC058770 TaxID=3346631 RepID=UPI0036B28112